LVKKIELLGKFIRERRQDLGLSAAALSRTSGVIRQHISSLENSKSWYMSEESIVRLADALMVDRDEMLAMVGRIQEDVLDLYIKDPKKWAKEIRDFYCPVEAANARQDDKL